MTNTGLLPDVSIDQEDQDIYTASKNFFHRLCRFCVDGEPINQGAVDGLDVALAYLRADGSDVMAFDYPSYSPDCPAHGRMLTAWPLILFGVIEQLVYLLITVAMGITFLLYASSSSLRRR